MSQRCGTITESGEKCKLPACRDDGKCWHHTDTDGYAKAGPKMSEPSKHEQETIAQIIEQGGSIREACGKAGIHFEQLRRWMQRGQEEPNTTWGQLYERITGARGQGEGMYRQAILRIAIESGDTATLMSMMKQRYPDSWGEVNRGEQVGGVIIDIGNDDVYEIDEETLEIVSQT